jgi:peptidoglycan hydrolase-like protein with peptidoglycan-binding domain
MPAAPSRLRRAIGTTVAAALLGSGLVALQAQPALAAYAVPPTTSGLPATIEAAQPYVGQATCDPVAKPGVRAFRDLLLRTYTDTGSFGIVRDCGAGGQSEHKEGRAFDWKVSAYNARQKGEADALISWLLKTDAHGNANANARRLGIMYVIWNKRIWKSYDPRWQEYHGASSHTDHVHFSFGWNGAKKVTSYWDKTVAQIDFGPRTSPKITPVRTLANLAVQRAYGSTYLGYGSRGSTVTLLQKKLRVPADGDYGSDTATAVAHFQVDQRLYPSQRWGTKEWKTLYPLPQAPIGGVDPPSFALGNLLVTGWAVDLDTSTPTQVSASLDGGPAQTVTANLLRGDVQKAYPEWGANHGFAFVLPVLDGAHTVCLTAQNATGTPGAPTSLGCRTASAQHSPVGALETASSALGVVTVRGWAVDPDSAATLDSALTVNGQPSGVPLTTVARPDIASRFPGMGDQHGVEGTLTLAEGTYQVCLSATNAAGTTGQDAVVGCRSVVVQHSPVGVLDPLRRDARGVVVTGWALDPDVEDPVAVAVSVDGAPNRTLLATRTRTELVASYPAQGSTHGFGFVLDLPAGSHSVCVSVPNAAETAGTDRVLPCRSVNVQHDASALALTARTLPGGKVVVRGDAYDPDSSGPVTVALLVDGKAVRTTTANLTSATAGARWPWYGSAHGFTLAATPKPGTRRLCVVATNATGTVGADSTRSCRTVVVSAAVGNATKWSLSGRTLTVRGWAIDPDSTRSTLASLRVDGRIVVTATANRYRTWLSTTMPGYGRYHGLTLTRSLSRGKHTVCLVAWNLKGTPGWGRNVSCRTVWVP